MKSRVAAQLLCLPYIAVLFNVALVWAWTFISERAGIAPPPGLLIALPFLAYYFVPSAAGIAYVLICQFVLILAWRNSPSPSRARRWIVAYNVILIPFYVYLTWWFATGQHTRIVGGYL